MGKTFYPNQSFESLIQWDKINKLLCLNPGSKTRVQSFCNSNKYSKPFTMLQYSQTKIERSWWSMNCISERQADGRT